MTAQTGYVADALVAELVRAAHERGVRAGLEAAARKAEVVPTPDWQPTTTYMAGLIRGFDHATRAVTTAIRSLDPTTIKEDADGRE